MKHPLYRVTDVQSVGRFELAVRFDDDTEQRIDFRPMLHGELYGPLRDPGLFARVSIDPEVHTLVWPNGADFDPATLHDWSEVGPRMIEMAQRWAEREEFSVRDSNVDRGRSRGGWPGEAKSG